MAKRIRNKNPRFAFAPISPVSIPWPVMEHALRIFEIANTPMNARNTRSNTRIKFMAFPEKQANRYFIYLRIHSMIAALVPVNIFQGPGHQGFFFVDPKNRYSYILLPCSRTLLAMQKYSILLGDDFEGHYQDTVV